MKYTKDQRQRIRHCVLDCEASGYTTNESISYIKEKLDIELSEWNLNMYKRQLRQKTINYHKHLRADQWAYKLIIHERISTVKRLIEIDEKLLLEVKDNVLKYHHTIHPLIDQIAELNKRLLELYLLLRAMEGNGWVDNGSDDTELSEITEQPIISTQEQQSERKF